MRVHLVVDGIVYGRQRHGGINTLFNAVLPRLAKRPDTTVEILVPDPCVGELPAGGIRRRIREPIRKTHLSWKLDRALEEVNRLWAAARVAIRPRAVFQSTYFTTLRFGLAQVAIVHDLNHEMFPEAYGTEFGRWLRAEYPRYLARARRIVAVSETTKRHAMRCYGIDGDRIDVVLHGVEHGAFFVDRSAARQDQLARELGVRPPYLLYVGGRNVAYKNFGRLLEVLPVAAARHGVTLVVAGPAWTAAERGRVEASGAGERLRLVENPGPDTLCSLYNFATAFVFPSLAEGFGLPLVEAMACGTVVIASSTEIFREVGGDVPIFFDPTDTGSLVQAIELAVSEEKRERRVGEGLERAQSFSWDRSAEAFHRVYSRVAGGG